MIIPPKNCPSCSSVLEWSNDQLYCKNDECPAKSFKQLEHFAKTLKIKGLGPSTIEKLQIYSIFDIYDLELEYVAYQLSSEKLAGKLMEEIERSTNESFNLVLPALGITLIGKTASEKLSTVATSIFDIDADTCKRAGLGPKATEYLLTWLEDNLELYCTLPFSFEFVKDTQKKDKGVVCITGKLHTYKTKAEAKSILESLGYTVKDSLTKDVTILVNESGVETAKTIKAANSGVHVTTNIKTLMENN